MKLLGLDLPFGGLKPRVTLNSTMPTLCLHLNKLKAVQDCTGKFLLYATPEKGKGFGGSGAAILSHLVQIGKELMLVRESLWVCLGRIGTPGVKCCLKAIGKYETESHERTKCILPEDNPFFIQLHGPTNKEHSNIVLDASDLDLLLIQEPLENEGLNWSSEFETMLTQGTWTLEDLKVSDNLLLQTIRNVSMRTIENVLSSPGTNELSDKLVESFNRLEGVQKIVSTMVVVCSDEEGEKILSREVAFKEVAHSKLCGCGDMYDRINILSEHANCVDDCL